jgi:hypothetical protein
MLAPVGQRIAQTTQNIKRTNRSSIIQNKIQGWRRAQKKIYEKIVA